MKKTLLTLTCALSLNALFSQTNVGFETWPSADPTGWTTLNAITAVGGPATTLQETAMPGSGVYAAKMITATCLICPSLTLPNPLPGVTIQQLAYTQRPGTVAFKWRGTVAAGDTSLLGAFLTLAGAPIGDALFQVNGGTSQATWLTQTSNFTYGSASAPDTMLFGAAADQYLILGYSGTSSTSTILYIDDFAFAGGTLGFDMLESNNDLIMAYPNPASTNINFNLLGTDATMMQVVDISGKMIYSENNILSKHILNVDGFSNGAYIVKFFNDKKDYIGSTQFNVVK